MLETKYAIPTELSGQSLKQLRQKLNMTQREFAALLNTSKPTIERWESGKSAIHGPATVIAALLMREPGLADKLRIPPKQLPLRLHYMYKEYLCTIIDVDPRTQQVQIKNYTNDRQFRAFGNIETPDYEQYEDFLASRCFPAERDKMKLILRELDLPFYDPFMIISQTEGRMAEDDFWIKIEK